MYKKQIITSGQLFTLLFICRVSLTILYSSASSGIDSIGKLIFPLIIMLPLTLLMLVPMLFLIRSEKRTCFNPSSDKISGIFQCGKTLTLCYGLYFLFSAAYSTASIFDFMNDVLPDGINPKIILSFLIIGCVYAALKGIEAISRMSLIVLMLLILISIITAVYLYPNYSSAKLNTAESLFSLSVFDGTVFLISRMNSAAVIGVFSDNIKNSIKRGVLIYSFISLVFILFTAVLICGSAGDYILEKDFQIFRAIDTSGVLQRLDPIFILAAVCSIFCNITLFFIAASKCISISVKKITEKKSVLISGTAVILFVFFLPEKRTFGLFYQKYLWAAAALLFTTVIPAFVLIQRILSQKNISIKRNISKIAAAGMIIFITVFLSGCSNLQLNNRIIIQGIGLDKNPDGYSVTVISLDTSDPKNTNSVKIICSKGKTVSSALDNLEKQHGKKLLFNQCLFIAMNRYASSDDKNTLGCFCDNNDIPKTVDLMTTFDSSEYTVISAVKEMGYTSEDISSVCGTKALDNDNEKFTLLDYVSRKNIRSPVSFPMIKTDRSTNTLGICGRFSQDTPQND